MGLFKRKKQPKEETIEDSSKPIKQKKSRYRELTTPPFPIEALSERRFLENLVSKIKERLDLL